MGLDQVSMNREARDGDGALSGVRGIGRRDLVEHRGELRDARLGHLLRGMSDELLEAIHLSADRINASHHTVEQVFKGDGMGGGPLAHHGEVPFFQAWGAAVRGALNCEKDESGRERAQRGPLLPCESPSFSGTEQRVLRQKIDLQASTSSDLSRLNAPGLFKKGIKPAGFGKR